MASKLTLNIDPKVVEAAKKYSEKKGVSISKLVEQYLRKITGKQSVRRSEKTSLMKLKGILGKIPADFNIENERFKYLSQKHK
jgi:hypothetical protein